MSGLRRLHDQEERRNRAALFSCSRVPYNFGVFDVIFSREFAGATRSASCP